MLADDGGLGNDGESMAEAVLMFSRARREVQQLMRDGDGLAVLILGGVADLVNHGSSSADCLSIERRRSAWLK